MANLVKHINRQTIFVGVFMGVAASLAALSFAASSNSEMLAVQSGDFSGAAQVCSDATADQGEFTLFADSCDGGSDDGSGGSNGDGDDGSSSGGDTGDSNGKPIFILDTDLGPDIDDAIALGMAHGYQKLGMLEIGAVTISRTSDNGARFADLVNTYYGYPDIPVGITREPGIGRQWDAFTEHAPILNKYDHDVHTQGEIPDGYKVLRKVLAASPDNSVIIAQVGFSTNLGPLLKSGPDEFSDLSGSDLVKKKVRFLSIMAGDNGWIPEFNVRKHVSSALTVINDWPTPTFQSEFTLGQKIAMPGAPLRSNTNHPIHEAYVHIRPLMSWHTDNTGKDFDMSTWDPLAVLGAIEPSYLSKTSPPGKLSVGGDGRTNFAEDANGIDRTYGVVEDYSAAEQKAMTDRILELVQMTP